MSLFLHTPFKLTNNPTKQGNMFVKKRPGIEVVTVIDNFLIESEMRVAIEAQSSTLRQARVAVVHNPEKHSLPYPITVDLLDVMTKLELAIIYGRSQAGV